MRRETSELKTEFTVDGAEAVAVAAIQASVRGVDLDHPASPDVLGHDVIQALGKAGFEIVRKPKPGSTPEERVEFARRTGCWDGVSDKDYRDWVQSLVPGAFVLGTVTELTLEGEDAIARFQSMTLEPRNVFELPPGTEIRAADAPVPCAEQDDWGLRENAADHLAGRHGCQVAISELDDARFPLSEGVVGDPQYVVVTERDGGRLVGLVEAWWNDDGDPIVPKTWLEIVLGARDVEHDPQRAA